MRLSTSIAGYALAASLTAVAAVHVYWTLGGSWGLAEALGSEEVDASPGLRVAAGAVAVALAVAASGVLARVGVWGSGLPWALVRWGTWVLAAVLVLVAAVNALASTSLERFLFAPLALGLAALAVVVAVSERLPSREAEDARWPELRNAFARR